MCISCFNQAELPINICKTNLFHFRKEKLTLKLRTSIYFHKPSSPVADSGVVSSGTEPDPRPPAASGPQLGHGSVRGRRVQRLPLALLAVGQDPPGAPLQTHLLRPVPGDHVAGQERAAHCGLPFVSPSDLRGPRPQSAGSPVGEQQAVGADT